ncbi:hypothetical protein [Sicyoidochytrium minutum DNA virus]|nr:hypothetical protein [Sicyoidochytrium minutum DNA virus]BDC17049.1 hypothetical protein [Sicyoidochytrium minutum DNA virus]
MLESRSWFKEREKRGPRNYDNAISKEGSVEGI